MVNSQHWRLLLGIAATAGMSAAQQESAVARQGNYWIKTYAGNVQLNGIERLRVITDGAVILRGDNNADPGGLRYSVKVFSGARDQREAEMALRSFDIRSQVSGDLLTVVLHPTASNSGDHREVTMTVPRSLRSVTLQTRGGNVRASGLEGEFEMFTQGGQVDVDQLNASAVLKTGGGNIHVGRVNGNLHCFSGGGSIRVDHAGGEVSLETAGGELSVGEASGAVHALTGGGNVSIDRAGGAVTARTFGGLIEVKHAGGPVDARSSGGAIQVSSAQNVRCEASSGIIRLRNVAGALNATTSGGNILAELVPGTRLLDSRLTTSAGDITVVIPSKIPVTVVAQNVPGDDAGRIVSDFPEILVKQGPSGYMPATAQGSLNGGGPVLRITTVGGTIYLRRETSHK